MHAALMSQGPERQGSGSIEMHDHQRNLLLSIQHTHVQANPSPSKGSVHVQVNWTELSPTL